MAVSFNGLVSGLDTDKIVSGLLDIQQQQLDRISARKVEIQRKQTAFRTLESKLISLRSDAGVLSRTSNNPFTKLSATASDPEAITATASNSAVAGVYQMTVNTTATAHQVASQGFTDTNAQITEGTFEIRLGSGLSKAVTIDSNNNTLSGLATAINNAGVGVSASIVQDSSGGATPYKLLLSSSRTGAANAITVTNNLAADNGGSVKPLLDFGTPVQAAADARVTLGSGSGAISVTSSTNQFKDVITGVTFDLANVSAGDKVSITVAKDTASAVDAVENFVESFNDALKFIDDNSTYNAKTEQGGVFLGQQNASRIAQNLRSTMQAVVPGASSQANRMSAVGITFSDSGRLVLNKSKLEDILNGDVEGVDATDVRNLFALHGESSNSGMSFLVGSARTKPSPPNQPYQIDITQAAEQASITAGTAPGVSTVIDSTNRHLEVSLDGKTATLSLTEGTYTAQQLADHLESVINESPDLAGRDVTVSLNSGKLQVTTVSYGVSSEVEIVSGSAISALGFTAGQTDNGRDVAGSFLVGGKTEPAIGRGRVLVGNPDNENTADLQVQVTLSSGQVVAGVEGTIAVSRGLTSSLDQVLGKMLDTENGILNSVDEGFDGQLDNLQDAIDRQTKLFDIQKQSILQQFQALETAISQMNATSSYLGGQLASLPSLNAGST
ncbi:MAG: flagellar filament capping protein FliD [Planctomycetota bacterium]